MLDADALAWGNLGAYDAIVTGVRAYERRADLRANNRRLLDYAENGGTLIVQYNKIGVQRGAVRAVSRQGQLEPRDRRDRAGRGARPGQPALHVPERDWRGDLEGLGPGARTVLPRREGRDATSTWCSSQDPFPANSGMKKGALVEAKVGKGRWIYVGLGLWRQLPAGTDGAYQLLANLISAGKAPQK